MSRSFDDQDDVEISTTGGPEVISNASTAEISFAGGGELVVQNDHGMQYQKEQLLQKLADDQFPLIESELIVKAFEKTVTGKVRASFFNGIRIQQVIEDAIEPKIGITFMPGADTPQVNQMEQIGMTQVNPDQKDAQWRVNTAGALLRNFEVDKDMAILKSDNTPSVIKNAKQRKAMEDGPYFGQSPPSKAVLRREQRQDHTVTIDSDNVHIVNDLRGGNWDLEATLVEVDQSSLVALMFNYRHLIHQGGPSLTFNDTIKLLDMMIEDARRLCIRSPILFRMSTRYHIISSKNTRYGVDHGSMFQTLTTSSGIKNIISRSAAYFNSLSAPGNVDKSQELIRPRFLQMLVLLLSLLNNDDLEEIKQFLDTTYRIRADRQHIELLVLKVLPLMSINPKIFLHSLIVAFDGPFVNPHPTDDAYVWSTFVQRLLQHNYFIPGTIEQLGQSDLSWVVKWPENGIKDTSVFNNLQYGGDARTINEIPPINLHLDSSTEELTVILTNGRRYIVASSEVENIIRMTQGKYSITEADNGTRIFDLDITEVVVTEPLQKAINRLNSVLNVINGFIAAPKRRSNVSNMISRIGSVRGRSSSTPASEGVPFPDIKASGRLSFHMALLGDQNLAVAYKIEGRKITRRDLIRNLASDLRKIRTTMYNVEHAMTEYFQAAGGYNRRSFQSGGTASDMGQTIHSLKNQLNEIAGLIGQAEQNKSRMEGHFPRIGDEPVSKVLYPTGAERSTADNVWHDYRAWYVKAENVLFVESQRRVVREVNWVNDEIVELVFHGVPTKFFVSPLKIGGVREEERWDEIKIDDRVVLVGGFVVVIEPGEMDGMNIEVAVSPGMNGHGHNHGQPHGHGGPQGHVQHQPEAMVNWLKITGVEQQAGTRRGQNRRKEVAQVRSMFR